jgi:hypothetical protein
MTGTAAVPSRGVMGAASLMIRGNIHLTVAKLPDATLLHPLFDDGHIRYMLGVRYLMAYEEG